MAYARFNAALNGLSAKVEFVRCDGLSEMGAERFDLIVSDPPVIPTPPGSRFFTHSDGGPYGTKVSRVAAARAVEVRPLVDRGLTGEALGREIERLRIEAIAALEPHE